MNITLKDFQPINIWKPDFTGEQYRYSKEPMFIIDSTTGRRYLNEDSGTIIAKSFLLIIGTPFVHPVAAICSVAYRILKIAILSHFWMNKDEEKSYDLKGRLTDVGADLLRIVATPLAIIGLELAAIYGLFNPLDGRKLYASIERAEYGNSILAPCFQPNPQYHAFGGDMNKRGVF